MIFWGRKRKQWEYCACGFEVIDSRDTDRQLDFYGKMGWELVSVHHKEYKDSDKEFLKCIFKRVVK